MHKKSHMHSKMQLIYFYCKCIVKMCEIDLFFYKIVIIEKKLYLSY